jgi:glycosyltransferase involved in cell wall biosynthesis
VWIEKEALPWVPASVELGLFRMAGARIVVDYDDATFHAYDRHRNPLVRRVLGAKIDRVMKAADLVIVGNAYLGARAKAAGARRIAELPTVVDLRNYPPAPRRQKGVGEPLTVGWIGSPLTSSYLDLLRPALAALTARIPLRLLLIGAAPTALAGLPVERVAWSQDTEAAEIARCDVGVMPLPDMPWERGKCGYKLIQFMASALPVVASPVGANRDIIIPGETGFLAARGADWVSALSRLHHDPDLRRRMGEAGRRRAEQLYSLQITAPRLVDLLRRLAAGRTPEMRTPAAGALP